MTDVYAVVDAGRCAATGMCRQLAPGAFVARTDALSEYRPGDWPRHDLIEAAENCPTAAIRVYVDGAEVT